MLNDTSINLHFEDNSESFYLIRFGRKEHLEEIQNGKIRFSSLRKYQAIENGNIGDKHEGLASVHYTDDDDQISFSHPCVRNGQSIDCAQSILSMWDYPDIDTYISCFSYFTANDIHDNKIFDDSVLEEEEWNYVLFVLDTKGFAENIRKSLNKQKPKLGKVKYLDYGINQEFLDAFSKSSSFKHQKEIRFAFNLVDKNDSSIKRIDDETIEVSFQKVQSVVIPTKEFREGFYHQ